MDQLLEDRRLTEPVSGSCSCLSMGVQSTRVTKEAMFFLFGSEAYSQKNFI
jgi:hypothetical protein